METEPIKYSVDKNIATLFINRPEVMNSFRLEDFELFINGLTLAENDPEVKVIRVKSAGNRVFSGGLDLNMVSEFGSSPETLTKLLAVGDEIIELFSHSKKPIVVQVQGPAVGWGTILCLNADFVIAGENPKIFFQLNEINIGLFPGTGALSSALLQMGIRQAKRMLLIPEKMFLDTAERYNLVTKRVPLSSLDEETIKFCESLAQKELILLMTIKGLLNNQHMTQLESHLKKERQLIKKLLEGDQEKALEYLDSLWNS